MARPISLARTALLALAAPALAAAAPLGLPELEAALDGRDEVRAASADLALADAQAARAQGDGGLRATTSAVVGALSEPQWPLGTSRDYGSLGLALGLRYPLLGSAAEERLAVATARLDALTAQARRDAARLRLRRELRESFFGYAQAQAHLALAEAFLADAPRIRAVLRRRQAAGLVLESDRRQMELAFARAERARDGAAAELAQRREELRRWSAAFDGQVTLPPPAALRGGGEALAQELGSRRAAARTAPLAELEAPGTSLLAGARGNVFVTGTLRHDTDLGNGGSVVAGLSLDWPLSRASGAGLAGEHQARVEQARLAVERLQADEQRLAVQALGEAEQAAAELRLARARVASAAAAAAEAAQRARLSGGADGAPIERWVRARAALHDELLALQQAEGRQALAAAQVALAFDGSGIAPLVPTQPPPCAAPALALLAWRTLEAQPPPAPACAEPTAAPAPAGRAFYAWDGPRALERAGDDAFWRTTRAGTLWLSFGADALARLQEPAAREALRSGLLRLHERGVGVALLLGEPSWLRPGQEQALFALVRSLADLPFDAIHLDVEPVQLQPPLPGDQAWTALARLARETRAIAGRPVLLSLNWRDLSPAPGAPCPACAAAAAADEVVVMLYATSPELVEQRMRALLARRPAPRLWLAQSIEPALGPEESFAGQGRGALAAQQDRLSGLSADPTFAGFAVQSLEDFLEARP
ncbi:MAG: TolC family protein [Anaeromyxobacter sp.]